MSSRTTTSDTALGPSPVPGRRGAWGAGRAWVAAGLVAVLAVVAAGWWATHPGREFRSGYGFATDKPVGATMWSILEHGGPADTGEVVITGIAPELTADGADLTIEYVLCDLDAWTLERDGTVAFGVGLGDRAMGRYCTDVTPAVGASMRFGTTPGVELLVGLTATRRGRSVVDHFRIDFREGWQRGSEIIAVTLDLTGR